MSAHWPTVLTFNKSKRILSVEFEDNAAFEIPFKLLREESPSAENKGHGNSPPPPRLPISENIDVVGADPVGRYAIRIRFSDGHATGLYTWALLRQIGQRM